jgi:hypothetical protein
MKANSLLQRKNKWCQRSFEKPDLFISGSELVLKLKSELDPELETCLLSLVQSTNDLLTDVAIYMSAACLLVGNNNLNNINF